VKLGFIRSTGGSAGDMVVRGLGVSRGGGGVLCVADTAAQSPQPEREELGAKVRASFLGAAIEPMAPRRVVARHAGEGGSLWTASDRALMRLQVSKPVRRVDSRPIWVSCRSPPSLPNCARPTASKRPLQRKGIADSRCVDREGFGAMWPPSLISSPAVWWLVDERSDDGPARH